MTERPRRQRIAAYADVRDAAGRILLVRTVDAIGGRWFLPGGGVEFGEHPLDAVHREVFEETGLTISAPELRRVISDVIEVRDATLHSIRFIYAAAPADPSEEIRHEVGGSTVMAEWFELAQLDDLMLTEFVTAYLAG